MTLRHPSLRLRPREQKRVLAGHPWIYSNEIDMDAAAKQLPPGALVTIEADDGRAVGTAMFNPHTLIAARMLSREPNLAIGTAWIQGQLQRALHLRERFFSAPYYRLVHAEADGLPGLVIDRYGDVLVVELNTYGMERLAGEIEAALRGLLTPRALVFSSTSAARALEGLPSETRMAMGTVEGPVTVEENGVRYLADLRGGQKTGWFFDQRSNRAFVAGLARGRRVLDIFSYTGGFGLACAKAGARDVVCVDRSGAALALAQQAADANELSACCAFRTGEAFETLQGLAGERFDVVVVDPPAFAKSRKDVPAALKGYRKLVRQAAAVTAEDGVLFVASCSHHVTAEALLGEIRAGLNEARRAGRLVYQGHAGPDHPIHPALPESAYLKAFMLAL